MVNSYFFLFLKTICCLFRYRRKTKMEIMYDCRTNGIFSFGIDIQYSAQKNGTKKLFTFYFESNVSACKPIRSICNRLATTLISIQKVVVKTIKSLFLWQFWNWRSNFSIETKWNVAYFPLLTRLCWANVGKYTKIFVFTRFRYNFVQSNCLKSDVSEITFTKDVRLAHSNEYLNLLKL